ncbi:hypothetical protein KCP77_08125 [Salmonella enterica subsp. enterica]|nr:hypothetical protein KCP77_08125 [Salmonella enterica subsp. enterica]
MRAFTQICDGVNCACCWAVAWRVPAKHRYQNFDTRQPPPYRYAGRLSLRFCPLTSGPVKLSTSSKAPGVIMGLSGGGDIGRLRCGWRANAWCWRCRWR